MPRTVGATGKRASVDLTPAEARAALEALDTLVELYRDTDPVHHPRLQLLRRTRGKLEAAIHAATNGRKP